MQFTESLASTCAQIFPVIMLTAIVEYRFILPDALTSEEFYQLPQALKLYHLFARFVLLTIFPTVVVLCALGEGISLMALGGRPVENGSATLVSLSVVLGLIGVSVMPP